MFVFGDTYDTPRPTRGIYTNSAGGKAWILDQFDVTAATRQSCFRWGGRFNMRYADGHAKAVQFRGGLNPGVGYVYVSAAENDRAALCTSGSEILDRSRFALGPISCRYLVNHSYRVATHWSPQ